MSGVRLGIAQRRVSLAALLPVLPAGFWVLAEVAQCRRRVALPHASRSPIVWNAGFGADARAGECTDGARCPRQLDQRRDLFVTAFGGVRPRPYRQRVPPFFAVGRLCQAVTVG